MGDSINGGRAAPLGIAMLAALLATGCTRVRDHKGYVVDRSLINQIEPGVDNQDSVSKTLGRPSFASEWDSGTTWYFLARDTRQLAFSTPEPVSQMLLTIRFNGQDVSSVQKTGLETIRHVPIYGKRTPVLGRERSFFSELFGNIGAVGSAGQTAPTADNPRGGGN
ncbi:outer membrane protein assembly factor BamE [Sphingomonas nostoxanthinifaciens]|uniref:outer membrane protein assembly factor BamE n=1 Tax=Sphingomonas nostoxanthinifaciens TaxID=2872652 RepID=UPI001CC1F550|nr:outer membrane protein assembly factor BamE [Sphingomonas nostoxanthinifaciens]UAK25014.1 outer membrane protein assembly factor BamE [Sphingomonas nostoxanthinifaciens]